jgi:D-tyrosyl-tRNA(Tyr) deacylase
MRTVIQRVSKASVAHGDEVHGISNGLVLLIGIEEGDNEEDIEWLVKKIVQLRIFDDKERKMNLSATDIQAELLVISQFTLHASTRKGNRPSYIKAAKPPIAIPLYNRFLEVLQDRFKGTIKTGKFGARMKVEIHNDGPVTLFIDTKKKE